MDEWRAVLLRPSWCAVLYARLVVDAGAPYGKNPAMRGVEKALLPI
ncbi:MAG: hypothetical protein ABWJ97_04685 [Thermoproteus sp.]